MLKIDLCFKLPADFTGDLNDALEALVKYRRGEKNHSGDFAPNPADDVYTNWWNMVHATDRVFYAAASLSTFDGQVFIDRDL